MVVDAVAGNAVADIHCLSEHCNLFVAQAAFVIFFFFFMSMR
jgi:hypothetical protein